MISRPISLTVLRSLENYPHPSVALSGSFTVEDVNAFWLHLTAEEHAALRAAHQAGRRLVMEIRVAPPTLEALASRETEAAQ